MPEWLTKATEKFGRKTIEAPEPFRITCSCEEVITGERTESNQLIRCSRCHRMIFVLPKNPYPAIKKTVSKKNKNKEGKVITKPKSEKATHVDKVKITQRVKNKVKDLKTRTREGTIRLIQKQKAFFTPFRLIILFTFCCILLTGYWLLYSSRVDSSTSTFQLSLKAGQDALEEKDFVLAEREYKKASGAAEFLELKTDEANEAHQYYKELRAFHNLTPQSFYQMGELATAPKTEGAPSWELDFESNYKQKWIIIDTSLYRINNADPDSAIALDCPLIVNNHRIVLNTDLSKFKELLSGETSRRVILGGQLTATSNIGKSPQSVVFQLDPESLFLWSHPEILREAGFIDSTDEELVKVIEEQTRFSGTETP